MSLATSGDVTEPRTPTLIFSFPSPQRSLPRLLRRLLLLDLQKLPQQQAPGKNDLNILETTIKGGQVLPRGSTASNPRLSLHGPHPPKNHRYKTLPPPTRTMYRFALSRPFSHSPLSQAVEPDTNNSGAKTFNVPDSNQPDS